MQVAGHEVVHYIKRRNKAGYKTLVKITETSLKSQGVDIEARIKEIQKLHLEKLGETLSRENAMEELVAESFSTVFLQEKAIQTLYETDEGTFRKVIEALKSFLSDLKAAIKGVFAQETAEMEESIRQCEGIVDEFMRVLNETEETSAATGEAEGMKAHISEDASYQIDEALNKTRREEVRLREFTPQTLVDHGVRDLPMFMNASHVRENILTEAEAQKKGLKINKHTHYHGLGKTLFMQAIDGLDNPIAVYRGTENAEDLDRRKNYFVILTKVKDADGNRIIVPIYIHQLATVNHLRIDANKIATVFGKEESIPYIQREIQKGNLMKIKSKSAKSGVRHYSPQREDGSLAKDTLAQKGKSVKSEFEDESPVKASLSPVEQEQDVEGTFRKVIEALKSFLSDLKAASLSTICRK